MKSLVLVLCALFVSVAGCTPQDSKKPEPFPTTFLTQTWEGVVLHGCGYQPNGWIENTNKLAVKIRGVHFWPRGEGAFGEITYFMKRLEAGEKYTVTVDKDRGFYIYTVEGNLMGWLSGECPSEQSK